jgi:hypothetical protein
MTNSKRTYGEEAFEIEFQKFLTQQLDITRDIVNNHASECDYMREMETAMLELLEDIDSQMRGGAKAKDLVLSVRDVEKLSFLMGQHICLREGSADGEDKYLSALFHQAGFSPSW